MTIRCKLFRRKPLRLAVLALALLSGTRTRAEDPKKDPSEKTILDGLAVLARSQREDGHFGEQHSVAITSIAGLAVLAGDERALESAVLAKAFEWLKAQQREGNWPHQGHTWVHGQGFATLFFAELYGKVRLAKEPPARMKKDELRSIVEKAVKKLGEAQSPSGGWFYTAGAGDQDEGSTTVCAVQALRAARNYGIAVEAKVLERGFAYLKNMQNEDGGFRYQRNAGGSMVAGSAGALSTLVLMQKLDHGILFRAVEFLKRTGVKGVDQSPFPEYALFYAMMAMKVIDAEYGEHIPVASEWIREIGDVLRKSQKDGGAWSNRGWMANGHSDDYATGFAALTLAVPRGRLSIFHRDAPKLAD